MKAIQIVDDSLVWADVPDPTPGPGEVLVQVHTTAVNRADLAQRRGAYPAPPGESDILGLECSGTIVALGDGVADWSEGDEVCALLGGGGYAERVVVPQGQLLPPPEHIDLRRAAAIPEVFTTAWLNLYGEAGAKPGERILLHAGASGVGTAAIQLGRVFDNPTFVVVGSDDKIETCTRLGAEGGWNRHQGDFAAAAQAWAPDGVDIILDPVGASTLASDQRVLTTDGRIVLIGLLSGRKADIDLGRLLVKRQRLIGSTLRSRPRAEKARILAGLREALWEHFAVGELVPIIETTFDIREAGAAHALVASNSTTGKVLLAVR